LSYRNLNIATCRNETKQIDRFFVCCFRGLWLLCSLFSSGPALAFASSPHHFLSRKHVKNIYSAFLCFGVIYAYLEILLKKVNSLIDSDERKFSVIFFRVCWWLIKINCYKEFIDPNVWCCCLCRVVCVKTKQRTFVRWWISSSRAHDFSINCSAKCEARRRQKKVLWNQQSIMWISFKNLVWASPRLQVLFLVSHSGKCKHAYTTYQSRRAFM
jgi:hypothetical protein